ncbi:MAG TPA: 2-dehydropantoate 2-reductase [Alphaproteobacteria bacterium]|nr:2-dehydropantoate 2-reductase [Alphaproteobacteria bacterium]
MKICVVGAGAIGGLLGGKLALAGERVTFIETNAAHRDAINRDGLKLLMHGGETLVAKEIKATADMAEPGPQDVVILAVKAHQISRVAPALGKLFGKDTIVLTVQNGIPWWYFQKHGGPLDGRRLASVDPDGAIERAIAAERIIGCVVYPAGEVTAPGIVKHVEGDRFPVGELDGSKSNRVEMISQMLISAGFKSFILDNIRAEIWLKAWGNLSFNPISALTHATLVDICRFALTRALAARMMEEAQAIAGKLGITFRHTIEKRIAGAEGVGKHKTSMLQDVEAGRALEVEALVGAIVELGELTGTPTPAITAVYACTKLLDKVMAEEHAGIAARRLAAE